MKPFQTALALTMLCAPPLSGQTPADQLIPRPTSISTGGTVWHLPDTLRISVNRPAAMPAAVLDVGRHWFPTEDVLRWIDVMARYKLNIFHWHLTEDQGWRLAINRYPRLTSVGAWRMESDSARSGGVSHSPGTRAGATGTAGDRFRSGKR